MTRTRSPIVSDTPSSLNPRAEARDRAVPVLGLAGGSPPGTQVHIARTAAILRTDMTPTSVEHDGLG